jgi:hypothetical protein
LTTKTTIAISLSSNLIKAFNSLPIMKFADALAPIDDVGEKVIDTTEEYVKKADDVILGRVMRIMDHVSI